MKSSLFLLLFALPFLAFGQQNAFIDFIGGIDYTYRTLSTSSDKAAHQSIIKARESEKGNLNWHVGFNYNRRLHSHIFLKTGLRLMSLGYHDDYNIGDLQWGLQHDGNGGFDPNAPSGETFSDQTISNNYWFLELPIIARYEFSNKKFTPYIEAGLAPAYYLLERHVVTSDSNRKVTTNTGNDISDSVQRVQLAGIVAFGCNYNVNKKLQLFGQPTFRYHLTSMWDTPLKERLWSGGVEIGLRVGY